MTGRKPGNHRPTRQGFTLIEVMMAIAVMTVGAMGIMALQQATTRGNRHARHMSTATQITRIWLERLQRDSLNWNQGTISAVSNGPSYLSNIPDPGSDPSAWFLPDDPNLNESYGFNYQGLDTGTDSEMRYCTHVRLRWVYPGDTIRAEVRTWWAREGRGADADFADTGLTVGCNNDGNWNAANVTTELNSSPSRLRAVYGSTLVRWTPM